MRTADRWGLPGVDPEIDTAALWKRLRPVREEIAATDDDPDRYRRMGVDVIEGSATMAGPHEVDRAPRSLTLVGAGPIGIELARCTRSRPRPPTTRHGASRP